MKRLIPLAILAVLTFAGAANAAQILQTSEVHHGMSPLAMANAESADRASRQDGDDVIPGPDHPGWLKDRDHAGWGWSDGRTETVMGLYHRNPDPEFLRNADIIQGGHGAAGLAISLKLGG